jgi:hypothetical protein
MSITREQVADLRVGDVVELIFADMSVLRGTLREDVVRNAIGFPEAGWTVRDSRGEPPFGAEKMELAVIERAPRPLYVNHDRTEPLPGDVIHASDGTLSRAFRTNGEWIWPNGTRARPGEPPYTLLVDGETGQVLP